MKTAHEQTAQLQAKLQQHDSSVIKQDPKNRAPAQAASLTEKHLDRIWDVMTRIYGHRFPSSYGTVDDGTWLAGLHDVTPMQIRLGLEKCRTNASTWPPTLPEFRSMCIEEDLKRKSNLHKYYVSKLPKVNIDLGKAAIAQCREKLFTPPKPVYDPERDAIQHESDQ